MGNFTCNFLPTKDLGQNLAYAMAYLWHTLWPTCGLPLILERFFYNVGI